MDRLSELLYIKYCYLYHSSRFGFSKRYLNKRIKELDEQIKEEKLKCLTNPYLFQ